MIQQDTLTAASEMCWNAGIKVLQGYRLADTDAAHVGKLLRYMAPKPDTLWLDIGSGFGEPARLMCEQRPDLSFFLLNNNAYQLERGALEFTHVDADMHDIPLGDATVDGCMFLYSLCHADDVHQVLSEAARVTMPGGGLFVYDYERLAGTNHLMRAQLSAQALPFVELQRIAEACGWVMELHDNPDGSDAVFRAQCATPEARLVYELIFRDLIPMVWRARRR